MDKNDAIKLSRSYVEKVRQNHIDVLDAWLFGSYAKNNAHDDSDIDIALVVNYLDKDYSVLNTEPILWRLKRQIDLRIEPHLIARNTDYAGFLDEIQQTGILIN